MKNNLDIVQFFYDHRTKFLFPEWTFEQIATYLHSYFLFNQVRALIHEDRIAGAIVFEDTDEYTIHIIHFATDKNPLTFKRFLDQLNMERPQVKYLTARRKFNKEVIFTVEKLRSLKGEVELNFSLS